MRDYQAALEKLRKDAAEAALIRDLATVPAKREMFDRLALHLTTLADQVELAARSCVQVGEVGITSETSSPLPGPLDVGVRPRDGAAVPAQQTQASPITTDDSAV